MPVRTVHIFWCGWLAHLTENKQVFVEASYEKLDEEIQYLQLSYCILTLNLADP